MKIRKAGPSDIDSVLQLMASFNNYFDYSIDFVRTEESLQEFFRNESLGVCLVLLDGESVYGYGVLTYGFSFEYGGKDAFVDEIFIQDEHRGKGWGERLMIDLIDIAKENGVKAIHLEVEKNNDQASSLYTRLDFDFSGRILRTKILTSKEPKLKDSAEEKGLPDRDLKDFLGCGG